MSDAKPILVRRGCEGWNHEYELEVEIYADHLVWHCEVEHGAGEAEHVRQDLASFLERGPPMRWQRFGAEHLQAEYPDQAIAYYWKAALDAIERALRDPAHDCGSWFAHLDSVAQIQCGLAGDVAGWRARVGELQRIDPAPAGFHERLAELAARY